MLDFHNHLIPGVDDGAASVDESREGLRALIADGVTEIITTPHIAASLEARGGLAAYLDVVEKGWTILKELVDTEFPQVGLHRGFEVMLDIPHPNLENPLLRLAGTKFALVEFPYMNIPPNSAYAIRELRQAGWMPIIAHPERYSNMSSNLNVIEEWRDAGAYMQVNAGSVTGQYGARAKQLVWRILQDGNADYICSDYHSRGRSSLGEALRNLERSGYESQLINLELNGRRVLEGEPPLSTGSFNGRARSGWKRLFPWA
jgi:protein-tyrosine phosphatase